MARIGEDEFAALAPARRSTSRTRRHALLGGGAALAGGRLRHLPDAVDRRGDPPTAATRAPDAAELLRRAELAVESAKTGGRGGAAAYVRGLETDGLSRLAMESDLRGAIGRGEIVPFFQPVVRLSTGAIAGFEALARWRHPRRGGEVPPDEFLPLCDEMGLLIRAGRAHDGHLGLPAWPNGGEAHRAAGEITVSVNLSVGEIDRPNLVMDVRRLIRDTGLPRGAFKLEITESDIMRDPEGAATVLGELRSAGAALARWTTSAHRLFVAVLFRSRLPFDTLKIDRYFPCAGTTPGHQRRLGQDRPFGGQSRARPVAGGSGRRG